MKTGMKIALGCAGTIALIILAFVGLLILIFAKKSKYDRIAIPFFEEAIPALSTWEPEEFEDYWAAEVIEDLDPDQLERLFGMFRKLGELEYYDAPAFQKVMVSTNNPYGSSVSYTVSAEFENGPAVLSFILVPLDDGQLKVWHLVINADAFLDPVEADLEPAPASQI